MNIYRCKIVSYRLLQKVVLTVAVVMAVNFIIHTEMITTRSYQVYEDDDSALAEYEVLDVRNLSLPDELVFLLIICHEEATDFSRAVNQSGVMIKSAVALTALKLKPPEDLWKEFHKFNSWQFFAMATNYKTSRDFSIPEYGDTGLNSGLILMNLTRMRGAPGGWLRQNLHLLDVYQHQHKTLTHQDIINILLYKRSERIRVLGCHWNFKFLCLDVRQRCPEALREGASLLRASHEIFVESNVNNQRFQILSDYWSDHQLGTSLEPLINKITLHEFDFLLKIAACRPVGDYLLIVLKQLRNFIERQQSGE